MSLIYIYPTYIALYVTQEQVDSAADHKYLIYRINTSCSFLKQNNSSQKHYWLLVSSPEHLYTEGLPQTCRRLEQLAQDSGQPSRQTLSTDLSQQQ